MQNKNGVDLIKVSLTRFQLASSFNFDGTRRVAMRWVAGTYSSCRSGVAQFWQSHSSHPSIAHSGSEGDVY